MQTLLPGTTSTATFPQVNYSMPGVFPTQPLFFCSNNTSVTDTGGVLSYGTTNISNADKMIKGHTNPINTAWLSSPDLNSTKSTPASITAYGFTKNIRA